MQSSIMNNLMDQIDRVKNTDMWKSFSPFHLREVDQAVAVQIKQLESGRLKVYLNQDLDEDYLDKIYLSP